MDTQIVRTASLTLMDSQFSILQSRNLYAWKYSVIGISKPGEL